MCHSKRVVSLSRVLLKGVLIIKIIVQHEAAEQQQFQAPQAGAGAPQAQLTGQQSAQQVAAFAKPGNDLKNQISRIFMLSTETEQFQHTERDRASF